MTRANDVSFLVSVMKVKHTNYLILQQRKNTLDWEEDLSIREDQESAQQEGVSIDDPRSQPDNDKQDCLVKGRAIRHRRKPTWMTDYTNFSIEEANLMVLMMVVEHDGDPHSYEEASQILKWREATNAEIKVIEKNKTWELTDVPKGVTPIGVKWIFKTKLNERGNIKKHKERLVAKRYS